MFPTFVEKKTSASHLVGTVGKRGLFIIWNDKQILDRQTYREIAVEAKENGIDRPYMIYGRIASYMGPGLDFFQIDAKAHGPA
jgi:adenine-specific DNA-methyltransferase